MPTEANIYKYGKIVYGYIDFTSKKEFQTYGNVWITVIGLKPLVPNIRMMNVFGYTGFYRGEVYGDDTLLISFMGNTVPANYGLKIGIFFLSK